jgi:hypothetical protein
VCSCTLTTVKGRGHDRRYVEGGESWSVVDRPWRPPARDRPDRRRPRRLVTVSNRTNRDARHHEGVTTVLPSVARASSSRG